MPFKRAWEREPEINITMDGIKMQVVEEAMHMEIHRSGNSQSATVHLSIEKARQTTCCLTGAGLHGINRLDPETSIHILQTYIVPIQVYGVEVTLVYGVEVFLPGKKTLVLRVEIFYMKL